MNTTDLSKRLDRVKTIKRHFTTPDLEPIAEEIGVRRKVVMCGNHPRLTLDWQEHHVPLVIQSLEKQGFIFKEVPVQTSQQYK